MSDTVYQTVAQLKGFSVKNCVPVPEPAKVLMCPPDHYEARDERNPFSAGHSDRIDPHLAHKQWLELHDAFVAAGLEISSVPAAAGLAEMVFCALDVGQDFVAAGGVGHQAHRHTGDRGLDRHTGIHQRQGRASGGGHRGGTIRGQDF